jgi:hypothetical protein
MRGERRSDEATKGRGRQARRKAGLVRTRSFDLLAGARGARGAAERRGARERARGKARGEVWRELAGGCGETRGKTKGDSRPLFRPVSLRAARGALPRGRPRRQSGIHQHPLVVRPLGARPFPREAVAQRGPPIKAALDRLAESVRENEVTVHCCPYNSPDFPAPPVHHMHAWIRRAHPAGGVSRYANSAQQDSPPQGGSLELHSPDCPHLARTEERNRRTFGSPEKAYWLGFCIDTGN